MDFYYDKIVGERIKRERNQKGWTQEQLSAKMQTNGCDLTRSAIAKIEAGQRHIYLREIKLLKEIFGVSFDDLLI